MKNFSVRLDEVEKLCSESLPGCPSLPKEAFDIFFFEYQKERKARFGYQSPHDLASPPERREMARALQMEVTERLLAENDFFRQSFEAWREEYLQWEEAEKRCKNHQM